MGGNGCGAKSSLQDLSSVECAYRCHQDLAPCREMDSIGLTDSVEDVKNPYAIPIGIPEQSKDCPLCWISSDDYLGCLPCRDQAIGC
jgi:hypothetical protein